jgi:hypothetical protein
VKPLFSEEERSRAVRNFIVACYQHEAKVNSYQRIVPYLEEKRVRILDSKLPKSGGDSYHPRYAYGDAQVYFEWLIGVVSGNIEMDAATIKEANNQLFQFIQILGDHIEKSKNVQLVAPYDWQNLFLSFDRELIDIKNTVDRHDKEILDILKSISELLKKNKNLLETLQKEYNSYFPKGESS